MELIELAKYAGGALTGAVGVYGAFAMARLSRSQGRRLDVESATVIKKANDEAAERARLVKIEVESGLREMDLKVREMQLVERTALNSEILAVRSEIAKCDADRRADRQTIDGLRGDLHRLQDKYERILHDAPPPGAPAAAPAVT